MQAMNRLATDSANLILAENPQTVDPANREFYARFPDHADGCFTMRETLAELGVGIASHTMVTDIRVQNDHFALPLPTNSVGAGFEFG
jgi:hypothetical protein